LGLNGIPDLPRIPPYGLEPGRPAPGWPTFLRPPITQTLIWWYRNINLFPIAYALRPRLRGRLTLSRLALLRKPRAFGEQVFHLLYRYLCQHKLSHFVHRSSRSGFNLQWDAPLPMPRKRHPAASVTCLSPVKFSAQTHSTSELLRFL
jgi:hypothetical protein